MENFDLKTKEGREAALAEITNNCRIALVKAGVRLAPDVQVNVLDNHIQIGLKDPKAPTPTWKGLAFGSEITLYRNAELNFGAGIKKEKTITYEIGFGTSGSFTPTNKNHATSYWRTVHAGSLVDNWAKVEDIIEQFTLEYAYLLKKSQEANPA